jgi:pilus assembly protein CpaB
MRMAKVVLIAFAIAGTIALLFYKAIVGRLSSEPKTVTSQVLVAARELGVGTLIRDVDVKMAPWPGAIPKGAALKKEDLIGRGVIANIYQDEPILDSRLAAVGAGAGLAAIIPPGMRAVAMRVNEVIGVAGFVVPGQRVDVLISGNPPGSTGMGTLSKTLLQNIQVLSAGQNMQRDAEGKPVSVPVVNVLVTPEQAEILSLASTETKIQLVLRNPLDTTVVKTPGTAVQSLFSGQKIALSSGQEGAKRPVVRTAVLPVKPKEAPVHVVEVIQGGSRGTVKFTEAGQ